MEEKLGTPEKLLSRIWKPICFASFVAFGIFQMLFHISGDRNFKTILHLDSMKRVQSVYEWAAVIFLAKSLQTILSWYIVETNSIRKFLNSNGIMSINFTITVIAGISACLVSTRLDFEIVGDTFGVCSPVSQIFEWIILVPLLFYYVLSMKNKTLFNKQEILMLFLVTISMVCFFIIHLNIPYGLAVFFLILCNISYVISIFIFINETVGWKKWWFVRTSQRILGENEASVLNSAQKSTQETLALLLVNMTPIFALIYYLQLFRVIDCEVGLILTAVSNLSTKLIFTSLAIDLCLKMIYTGYVEEKERVDESRQAYMRFIMHDVRVPLSTISMGIDALVAGTEDNGDSHQTCAKGTDLLTLEMMREATNFMGDTLNSALTIQKIEEGKFVVQSSRFRVLDLIRKIKQTLAGIINQKGVRVFEALDPSIPAVLQGDRFQIEHVLANLLSNAVKFSHPGARIDITVKLCTSDCSHHSTASNRNQNNNNNHNNNNKTTASATSTRSTLLRRNQTLTSERVVEVYFGVQDQGVGIAEEDLQKLFKPFSQIQPDVLQGGGGSGVGLSICKGIVEALGGTISCQSTVGVGSTFSIVLPFAVCSDILASQEGSLFQRPLEIGNTSKGLVTIEHQQGDSSKNVLEEHERQQLGFDLEIQESPVNTLGRMTTQLEHDRDFHPRMIAAYRTHDQCELSPDMTGGYEMERASGQASTPRRRPHSNSFSDSSSNKGLLSRSPKRTTLEAGNSSPRSSPGPSDRGGDTPVPVNTVLIVDDSTANRKLLVPLLRSHGRRHISCEHAEDGLVAVATVRENIPRFDVIFMDNLMPRMDGVEATRVIRSLGFPNLIIGLTGSALEDERNRFLQAGADIVYSKPAKLEHLDRLFEYIRVNGNKSPGDSKLMTEALDCA